MEEGNKGLLSILFGILTLKNTWQDQPFIIPMNITLKDYTIH